MKTSRLIILFLCLFCLNIVGYTQTDSEKNASTLKADNSDPLYVLVSGNKMVEIDPEKGEKFNVNSIDPNSIQSIDVVNGKDALDKFGDKAENGAVIIYFKQDHILSKEVYLLFESSK
jgi:hypothetical protein